MGDEDIPLEEEIYTESYTKTTRKGLTTGGVGDVSESYDRAKESPDAHNPFKHSLLRPTQTPPLIRVCYKVSV